MALKIRNTANPDLIGDIQPGWSIDENATPHAIGDGSASVGGVQFSAARRDDSEFLLNKPVTVYYEPEGTVTRGNNVTGVFDSVDAAGASVSVTSTNKLSTLTAERRAEPIFPNKLYNSFTDPTAAGAVILSLGGVAVDAAGILYAVDRGYAVNRVARYDSAGAYLGDFNLVETGGEITAGIDKIYIQPGVSGSYGSAYGLQGGFLYFLNDNLGGDTSVNGPPAVDPSGNVYVFAGGQDRVKKFNSVGTFVGTYGNGRGTGDGFFGGGTGSGIFYAAPIVADSSNFYVLDAGNNRVQSFSAAGAFASKFTVPAGASGMKATGGGNLLIAHPAGLSEYTKAGTLVRTTATVPNFWTFFNNNIYYGEVPTFMSQMQSAWQIRRTSYAARAIDADYMPGNGPVVGGDTANSLPFIFNSVTGTYMVPSPTTKQINEYDLAGTRISTFGFNEATRRLDVREIDYSYDGTIYGYASGISGIYSMQRGGTPTLLGNSPRAISPFSVHKPSGDYYYVDNSVTSIIQRDKLGNTVATRSTGLGASTISSIFVTDDRTVYFSIRSGASNVTGIYRWINSATSPVRVIAQGSLALGAPIVDAVGGSIFVPDSYTTTIRGAIFLREYTLGGTFIRTDLVPDASPYEGFFAQVVAPRTLAVRTGSPAKSISLSPTGAPALSSALTIYLSYTGRVPNFSGSNPAAVYPGWTDSVWTKLNELCAATGKEIILQNDSIFVRDIGSAFIGIDDIVSSSASLESTSAVRNIGVISQNTSIVNNDVVFDNATDRSKTLSVGIGETSITNIETGVWLTSVGSLRPVLGDSTSSSFPTPGTYWILAADDTYISPETWISYGGYLRPFIGEDGTSVDLLLQGPYAQIGPRPGPYVVATPSQGDLFTGFSLTGSGVKTQPEKLLVPTGADWSITSAEIGQTIDNLFITSPAIAYDRAPWTCSEYNGSAGIVSLEIPTSAVGELGITPGATFVWNKARWRVLSSTFENASISITARRYTTVGEHDAQYSGQTIGQHDARLTALTLGDSTIKPLY